MDSRQGDRDKYISDREIIRRVVSIRPDERVIVSADKVEGIKVKTGDKTVYVYFLPKKARIF